jgi:predicted neutral ceramidase superfamily lipid hydrolase
VQSVKQREAAAYVVRLNEHIQVLQQQQVARDHRASLREQRNFFLAIICAIILVAIAILLFLQHISLNQANKH